MSRHSKDRKKKQKEKLQAIIQQENTVFDIITLLKTIQIDTKPNLGKFLKDYVLEIRGLVFGSKIIFYPQSDYQITKIFVKFLDGHELIYNLKPYLNDTVYFYYFGIEEVELKQSDLQVVQQFFNNLLQFGFVTNT